MDGQAEHFARCTLRFWKGFHGLSHDVSYCRLSVDGQTVVHAHPNSAIIKSLYHRVTVGTKGNTHGVLMEHVATTRSHNRCYHTCQSFPIVGCISDPCLSPLQ